MISARPGIDRRGEKGPFDIIGDVHGCADELESLMSKLGYIVRWDGRAATVAPPYGRRCVFLGDLVDRGPRSVEVLRIAGPMAACGTALVVLGNHDDKLRRFLAGNTVRVGQALRETIEKLRAEGPKFVGEVSDWLNELDSHYLLDEGRLVVAHAGLKEEMQGDSSRATRAFALYGETTGELDQSGLPIRGDWAASYRGDARVVYGHTPVSEPRWVNGTLCIDTGCCFGGSLTALRYPEMELVAVPALRAYRTRPNAASGLASEHQHRS